MIDTSPSLRVGGFASIGTTSAILNLNIFSTSHIRFHSLDTCMESIVQLSWRTRIRFAQAGVSVRWEGMLSDVIYEYGDVRLTACDSTRLEQPSRWSFGPPQAERDWVRRSS
jgi:hypothetical protein